MIIGAGPAGLFAALALAENGFAPLLLEQGDPVEVRAEKVEAFWRNGDDSLDLHSNVQFGEGGAGTFSDGKLNTLVKVCPEGTERSWRPSWRPGRTVPSCMTAAPISGLMFSGRW